MRYKVELPTGHIVYCKNRSFWTYAKLKKTANKLKGNTVICYDGPEDNPKIREVLLIDDMFDIKD